VEEIDMVSLTALWLPIVLAAVVVFIASSVIHMVFKYHNSEYRQLPGEGAVLDAMRSAKTGPGFYSFPYAGTMKEMGSPEMSEKYTQGPVGTVNINPSGPPAMGKNLNISSLGREPRPSIFRAPGGRYPPSCRHPTNQNT
jgi:hypothetical protein